MIKESLYLNVINGCMKVESMIKINVMVKVIFTVLFNNINLVIFKMIN